MRGRRNGDTPCLTTSPHLPCRTHLKRGRVRRKESDANCDDEQRETDSTHDAVDRPKTFKPLCRDGNDTRCNLTPRKETPWQQLRLNSTVPGCSNLPCVNCACGLPRFVNCKLAESTTNNINFHWARKNVLVVDIVMMMLVVMMLMMLSVMMFILFMM